MGQFQDDIKRGAKGEEIFISLYPRRLEICPEHYLDLRVVSSRESVELKTDYYNHDTTANFFMERWSSIQNKTAGGPWKSALNRIDIFCYFFINNGLWYEFRNIPGLVARLNTLVANMKMVYIKNVSWTTGGYIIPRAALEDLYTVVVIGHQSKATKE